MRTSLPVQEVEDKQPVVGGVIYVAPPNYHLLIERGGNFALSADEQIHFSRPAIDILFDSASDSYRERLAGIILTGANADGARGLATIKRRGGLAIVQSPIGAIARNMPDAAIAASRTAHVLSLEEIASWLKDLAGGGPLKESQ